LKIIVRLNQNIMKAKIKIIPISGIIPFVIAVLAIIFPADQGACQIIRFSYDDSGNRIKREPITVESINAKDKDIQRFLTKERLDGSITVTPDNNQGRVHIDIKDKTLSEPYSISLYAMAGYMVCETTELSDRSDIDISNLPNGLYVLLISRNGKSNAWKIYLNR